MTARNDRIRNNEELKLESFMNYIIQKLLIIRSRKLTLFK